MNIFNNLNKIVSTQTIPINSIVNADCLEAMKYIEDKSIDMIFCDLPYGTIGCTWDVIIPFNLLWDQYKRIIKDNCAIVLTGSQPFTSLLINSNLKWFKHEWIWEKPKHSNFFQAKYAPLKIHENILVFSNGKLNYYPQKTVGKPFKKSFDNRENFEIFNFSKTHSEYDNFNETGLRNPKSIQKFNTADNEKYFDSKTNTFLKHPTQKPISLIEYFIKTFTIENSTILDNCMGSGSTCVACVNTNRNFIGIEKKLKYFDLTKKRLNL